MKQYSWFMSINESSTHEIAKSGLRRFEVLLEEHGGQAVTHAGDGLIARLDSAIDAIELVVAFQDQMNEDPLPLSESDMAQFRIGVHVADVINEDGNIHGTGVNIAKRLESLADPGGILISRPVHDQIRDKLEYQCEFIGPLRLKNIPQSVEAYRLLSQATSSIMRPSIRHNAPPLPMPNRPSIAVLPFKDMSANQDQSYFCNGVSQEIVSNLSKFHDLFVISYNSSAMFRGVEATTEVIGRELGVEYILLGSVNRSSTRMRVSTQLVDTRSGNQVWADKFDNDVEHIFDFQDDVTQLVAARLATRVEGVEIGRTRSKETQDLKAYGLVLQAQESFLSFTSQGNRAARLLYEKAIERDSKYARAYAALSRTHIYDWRYLWSTDPNASFEKALETAKIASKLDEGDARGFAELGFVYLWSKKVERAIRLYERALLLNPNSADILAEFADALAYAGQLVEAKDKLKAAMRLNPFYPDWYLWYLADIYYGMGCYTYVVETIEQMRDPSEGCRLLAAAHAMLGDIKKAQRYARKVLEKQPNFSVSRWAEIQPDMNSEIRTLFLEGLLRSGLPQ